MYLSVTLDINTTDMAQLPGLVSNLPVCKRELLQGDFCPKIVISPTTLVNNGMHSVGTSPKSYRLNP
jgi:hypothetical protein